MKLGIIVGTAVAAAIAVAASLAAPPSNTEIEKADLPGIVNFSRIEGSTGFAGPSVGFGGATQISAMPELKSAGFATVINLRFASEEGAEVDASRDAAQAIGLNYIHLPFDPKNTDKTVINDFLAALGDKANQPVYIHCGSATRAAALWMVGRVLVDGWDIDAAAKEAEAIAQKPEEAIAFATRYLGSE